MPNRYVRESAIESVPMNSLSWMGEVFYRRLLNRADDFGRFTANPALLRASLFPLQLDKVREADISRLLAECEEAGLLFVYEAEPGKPALVINKWEKGRAKESRYAAPPDAVIRRMQTYVYGCKHPLANAPDSDSDSDTDTDTDTDTDKGRAGKPSVAEKSQIQLRAEKLHGKRATTPWDKAELAAWKAAQAVVAATKIGRAHV